MSIYQFAKEDLASIITSTTGRVVTAAQFTVVAVRATREGESTKNSKAYVTFTEDAPILGSGFIYYDRLDIKDLVTIRNPNCPLGLNADPNISPYLLLKDFRDSYGVNFTTDDLEDIHTTPGPGTDAVVTLKAKASSPGWIGSLTVIVPAPVALQTAFANNTLPDF